MGQPALTFYCELEADELAALVDDGDVVDDLLALDARVSLGILDLSDARAHAVRDLSAAGVPVVAWLLLPEEDGYWFSASNADEAVARWEAVRVWTADHGLEWAGIGLDAEMDRRDLERLAEDRGWAGAFLLRRLRSRGEVRRARATYAWLADQIRAAGYEVEHYLLPFMLDERRAGSLLVQQLTGIVDVPGDRHVPMLYTSFVRKAGGPGIIWSYGPDVHSIAVGSTGGGVVIGNVDQVRPLDWEEFRRDLLLARRFTDDLFVFSLEGCADQGYLAQLRDFDWDAPADVPFAQAARVERFRRRLRALLWLDAHPLAVAAALAAAPLAASIFRRVLKRLPAGANGATP